MRNECKNIYKIARKNAGFTQDEAAERLYISTRSIADYESGKTIPPDDVVCRMIELYDAPWLGYQHLRYSSEVGKRYLPDITLTDLARAVLRFQKEVRDIDSIDKDMIDIACDGEINDDELDRWQQVRKEIDEMAGAALAIMFTK
ncbi:helix-turn-helix transcriptional regulator [Thermoanaerobacterium thermosaccharolyticum]|uniref:helix-turn-helix transcriptional regulator n=1 Tax=Thermoanaerobacterium thermosaccharolyticum TaxID=1517 RepID=UPI003DAA3D16